MDKILILGGTGTLGSELINQLYQPDKTNRPEITVLSRDEHKQSALKKRFPDIICKIGDIRNPDPLWALSRDKDVVFHVAALKHVDILEDNIGECVRVNIDGTFNAVDAAKSNGVKYFVFSSTDKAVDPINVYGYSKAIAEKYVLSQNDGSGTRFSVYRWGNVLGSNGSVIPHFIKLLKAGLPIPITSNDMTRFWIPIEDAVSFMLFTFKNAYRGKATVPPLMKSASVLSVVDALSKILDKRPKEIEDVGLRPGEKIHESLFSIHSDYYLASNTSETYTEEELIELLTPIVKAHA